MLNYAHELPFGKGAMDTGSPGLNAIVSGRQFNGLINFRQGLPYNVVVPGYPANIFNAGAYLRPNLVGDPRKSNPTPERWINPTAVRVRQDRRRSRPPRPGKYGKLVGPPRFELGTSSTPRKRATRLRYGPTPFSVLPAADGAPC